jgi:hypothetical protein
VRSRSPVVAVVGLMLVACVSCSSSGSRDAKATPTTRRRVAPTTTTTVPPPPEPTGPAFAISGCSWLTPADLASALIQPRGSDSGPWRLDRPISEFGNPAGGGRTVMSSYNEKWRADMRPGTMLLDAWVCQYSHTSSLLTSGLPDFVRLYFWKWSQPLTPQEWRTMIPHSPLLASPTTAPIVTADVQGLGDWAITAQSDPRSVMVGDGTITFEVQSPPPHATTELVPLAHEVQSHLAG